MRKLVLLMAMVLSMFLGFEYTYRFKKPSFTNEKSVEVTKDISKQKTKATLAEKKVNSDEDIQVKLQDTNNKKSESQNIASFIPQGWNIIATAKGDLNKDGISDRAIITEKDDSPSRKLIILFGTDDDTYELSVESDNAILDVAYAGTFGDPLQSIEVNRGSVLLKFMGGSQRWYRCFRFRYQNKGWYLIGFTEKNYKQLGDSMIALQDDYNLLNGDYIGDRLVNDKVKTVKQNIGKRPLLNLTDFSAKEYQMQY